MFEYELMLNQEQCHEVLKAVELLMRLKLGQYQEIIYTLCEITNPEVTDQISEADTILKHAFTVMNKGKSSRDFKDEEWRILYDLYQVLRKGIHDAENPDGNSLDASEPIQFGNKPLAKINWTKKG